MALQDNDLLRAYLGTRKLSENTRAIFIMALRKWSVLMGKQLHEATADDFGAWYNAFLSMGNKPSTILTYATKLRMLTLYSLGRAMNRKDAKYLNEDLWFQVPFSDLERETGKSGTDRDKLISEEELHELLKAASHPRVKAFIAVLFESACRKGELKSLKIRDLVFGSLYTEIRVNGKTGERTIPLVFSVPYLRAWLQVHPDRRPDQWLFAFERKGKIDQMKRSMPNATIRYICKKAGIRHIHPHMLRHTHLTELAKSGVGEYQMKGVAGWTMNSKMPGRYIHLSGRDHINAVLEAQGIEVPAVQRIKPMLSEGRCPQCDAFVGASMLHCPGCGYILDPNLKQEESDHVTEIDRLLQELRQGRAESDRKLVDLEERMEKRLKELREN